MKSKFTSLRTLLLTAALAAGAGTWADSYKYTVLYGTPVPDEDGFTVSVDAQTDFAGDPNELTGVTFSDANGAKCAGAMPIDGSVLYANKSSWTKNFETPITKGQVVFAGNYNVSAGNNNTFKILASDGSPIFISSAQTSANATLVAATVAGQEISNWIRQPRKCAYGVKEIVIDLDARTVTYDLIFSSGNNSFNETTGTVSLPESITDVKGLSVEKTSYGAYLDYVKLYAQEKEEGVMYTINYVVDGNIVKTDTDEGLAGRRIALTDAQKANFTVDGVNYAYDSDDAESLRVAEDGSTVVTVTCHEAAIQTVSKVLTTWDFKSYGATVADKTGVATSGETIKVNNNSCSVGAGFAKGLAFWGSWIYRKGGLYSNNSGNRYIVFQDLKAGDVINITCDDKNIQPQENVEGPAAKGGGAWKVIKDGNATLLIERYIYISSITITHDYDTDMTICETPTIKMTGTYYDKRTFVLDCVTPVATLYWAEEELEPGDPGWKTFIGKGETKAQKIWFYGQNWYTNKRSDVQSYETDGGYTIQLNAPQLNFSGLAQTNLLYYPVVTIVDDQNSLPYTPEETFLSYKFNGAWAEPHNPFEIHGTGTLTVTVRATGFGEASSTYTVDNGTLVSKTIDLTAITADDLENLSSNWKNVKDNNVLDQRWWRYFNSLEHPLWQYTAKGTNTDVIDGLSITADSKVNGTLLIGCGYIHPLGGGNNQNMSVDGITADEYSAWTFLSSYGASTKTTFVKGTDKFPLYRFSDMLTKVQVFSPVPSAVTPVLSRQYTAFSSEYPLELSRAEGVEAYYAVGVEGNTVKLAPATGAVKAGTGLILKRISANASIPVTAEGHELTGNLLKGSLDSEVSADYYALGAQGDGSLVKVEGMTAVPAGDAYLQLGGVEGDLVFDFGNNVAVDPVATGISTVSDASAAGTLYNLGGQRVAAPQKGLYIVGGKKMVVK